MKEASADTIRRASFLEMGVAYTAPLDAAIEYLRLRITSILPMYVIAMIPHAVVVAMLIDAITAERRSIIPRYCIYLCVATVWRWIGLTWIQRFTQRDLQSRSGRALLRQLVPILLLRLFCNVAMTWGILAIGIPAFYGMFLSGFATPLLLDDSTPARGRIKKCLLSIHNNARRLLRVALAMLVFAMWLVVVISVIQYYLLGFVLPHLFDLQLTEVEVTMSSWAWWLGVLYFAFLVLDMFWAVASVVLYYESQSRRMGTGLYAQLAAMNASAL